MKWTGAIAVLLTVSIPGGAFAQNISAAVTGASAEAGAAAAAGSIRIVPGTIGALTPLSMSAPSMSPSLGATPALTPAAALALQSVSPLAAAPSAVKVISAAPPALFALKPAPAAPDALKAGSPLAEALIPRSPAAAKEETPESKSWTDKLATMFDGGSAKKDAGEIEPGGLKAFVVRYGGARVEIPLSEAASHRGPVRLLTAKNDPTGLSEKQTARVSALINSDAKIQQEQMAVNWSPKAAQAAEAAAEKAAVPAGAIGKLTWPFREAKFLAKAFGASLVKPTSSEIVGGFATKTFPLVTSIGVYWAAVGLAHPLALGGLIALSVTQEVFHGFFLKSWNNFQEELRRARGFNYQMFFNLAYMQGFGTLYRLLSWSANPASVTPPWTVHYWKDIAVMSVIGTFFGVLGYNSLNALYAKGSIKRWQHSGIQQLRDLCFLLAGPFFASGSMTVFWSIFLFQQSLDLAIAIWAGRAQAKPILFVTSAAVAASPEFNEKYPEAGLKAESPLKQAIAAVSQNPVARILSWPVRALWKLVRGGKK